MFRACRYARVSVSDRQTLPAQSDAARVHAPAWLADSLGRFV